MAGRPKSESTFVLEKNFEIYQDKLLYSDGKLFPPKNGIWTKFRSEYNVQKTEKVIYTAAAKWLKDKKKLIVREESETNDISVEATSESEKSASDDDCSEDDWTDDDRSGKTCVKNITINISSKIWEKIIPKEIECNRKIEGSHKSGIRTYITLEPGLWTTVFASEISKHDGIPCIWSFKRNKCYKSGEKYLEFMAKCNTCRALLVGVVKKKPDVEDESVKINIQIFDIKLERHNKEAKKVKLTSRVAKQLYTQNKNASTIRRSLLKDSTKMFTEPTSRTMTANAVRCIKYRERKKEKFSECPITSLLYLKSSHLFMNCIQRIGMDPFYVFYCTPEQAKLFHEFKKRNEPLKVSCDATGGIVHKIGNFFFILSRYT